MTDSLPSRPRPDHRSLDAFRGIVCLGVVVMHLYMAEPFRTVLNGVLGPEVDYAVRNLRFGVETFFVLSGYFLAHMFRPAEERFLSVPLFLRRRIIRLAVPYWVVLIAGTAGAWALHGVGIPVHHLPEPIDVAAAFVFLQDVIGNYSQTNLFLWSMAPLFQFYLLATILFWCVRRFFLIAWRHNYQSITQSVLIGFTILLLVCSMLINMERDYGSWTLPRVAWAFALGLLTYWGIRGTRGVRIAYILAVASIMLVGIGTDNVLFLKACVGSLCLFALGFGLVLPTNRAVWALAAVGRRSFSLYLTHGLIGVQILTKSTFLDRENPAIALPLLVLALTASLLAGIAFYELIERPTGRMARAIDYRR